MSGDTDGDCKSSAQVSYLFIITQVASAIPAYSAACGHSYSEQGILAHLKRSKKCPVAGCQAVIVDQKLERDVEMEVMISRMYATCARVSQRHYDGFL